MPHLKYLQSALGWFLIGLLSTYALINAIGFVSPFWALWWHDDPSRSRSLLHFWQPVTAWFSIFFLVGSWQLARTSQNTLTRIVIVAMGVLVVVAEVGSGFAHRAAEASEPLAAAQLQALETVADGYLGVTALVFLVVVWRKVRQASGASGSNPVHGPA